MVGGYQVGNFLGIEGEVKTIREAEGVARDGPRRNTPNSSLTFRRRDVEDVKHTVDVAGRCKRGDFWEA